MILVLCSFKSLFSIILFTTRVCLVQYIFVYYIFFVNFNEEDVRIALHSSLLDRRNSGTGSSGMAIISPPPSASSAVVAVVGSFFSSVDIRAISGCTKMARLDCHLGFYQYLHLE